MLPDEGQSLADEKKTRKTVDVTESRDTPQSDMSELTVTESRGSLSTGVCLHRNDEAKSQPGAANQTHPIG